MKKPAAIIICIIFGYFLMTAVSDLPALGDANSPANTGTASYYLTHSLHDSNVPNVVTSVLADYRGFDTMCETAVVFVACVGIFAILRRKRKPKEHSVKGVDTSKQSLIMEVGCRFMVAPMQLFALYVVAHGHHSPGGGFQGGVILGASLILMAMCYNLKKAFRKFSEKMAMILVAVGVLIYSGIGAVCLKLGGNFLDYSVWHHLLPYTDSVMARSHGMLGVEIGVALTVMSAMYLIYASISSDGTMDRGL